MLRFGVGVEGDRPLPAMGLDLIALPETALDVLGPDFAAKLPPDFLSAGAEQLPQRIPFLSSVQSVDLREAV